MSNITSGLLSPRAMLGAAIVGLIGAAGMCIIEQIYNDRRRVMLAQDLARLDKQVASMKEELDNLKELQARYMVKKNATSNKRPKHTRKSSATNGIEARNEAVVVKEVHAMQYASDTDFTEYNSAMGTDYDVSSEEFYDMSSDSDEESRTSGVKQNGSLEINQELKDIVTVDELLSNGSDEDVSIAFKMLKDMRDTVESGSKKINKRLLSDVLWRLGKCCQRKSNVFEKNGDKEGKKDVIFEGIEYCEESVVLDDENPEAHKWYAILVGLRSDYVRTKEKIQDGILFKEHVEKALLLNPNDASLYHLIGRFKLELATLSWLEKKIASTLFAEVPSFTYDNALDEFKKAEELIDREWKENRFLIAKCYIGKGEYSSGVRWLDKTLALPINTSDDEVVHSEARKLLSDYDNYRED